MKTITLEPGSGFAYQETGLSIDRSLSDIKDLLKKFKCEETLVYESGINIKLAFKKSGIPYVIDFPLVYIEGKKTPRRLAMEVSGRIIFNKIKAVLIDVALNDESEFMQAMLRYIGLPSPQGMLTLGELVEAQKDRIIKGQIEFDPQKIKLLAGAP